MVSGLLTTTRWHITTLPQNHRKQTGVTSDDCFLGSVGLKHFELNSNATFSLTLLMTNHLFYMYNCISCIYNFDISVSLALKLKLAKKELFQYYKNDH